MSRLQQASIFPGSQTDGTPSRDYGFAFDVAGNRTQKSVATGGAPTINSYSYDAANRLSNAGITYDNAGRMLSDGVDSYTWDRAGRLRSAANSSYAYNGIGQRLQQSIGGVATDYTLDVVGMPRVMAATTNGQTTRYLPGMSAHQQPSGDWQYWLTDALGSVRGVVDNTIAVQERRHYAPYGEVYDQDGNQQTDFGFTGEQTDPNDLVYLRARYYHPDLGAFLSLDPLHFTNRYAYVNGNPINFTDPSGESPFLVAVVIGAPIIAGVTSAAYDAFVRQGAGGFGPFHNPDRTPITCVNWEDVAAAGVVGAAGAAYAIANTFLFPAYAAAWGVVTAFGGDVPCNSYLGCLLDAAGIDEDSIFAIPYFNAGYWGGTAAILAESIRSIVTNTTQISTSPIDTRIPNPIARPIPTGNGTAAIPTITIPGITLPAPSITSVWTGVGSIANAITGGGGGSNRNDKCDDEEVLARRNSRVEQACKQGKVMSCKSERDVKRWIQRVDGVRKLKDVVITKAHIDQLIRNNDDCVAARLAVQECFDVTDTEHSIKIKELQNARKKCVAMKATLP